MIINQPFDELFRTWSHIAILRVLRDTVIGFSGNEAARLAGMDPKAAFRALNSLEILGLVRRQRGGRDHIFNLNRSHYLIEQGIVPLFEVEENFFKEVKTVIAKTLKPFVVSSIIFGSVAKRQETPLSDLDICCIVKNNSQKEKAIMALNNISNKLYDRFGLKLGPIFLTVSQFKEKASKQNTLITEILEYGKLVVGLQPRKLLHA
jgi:predicted nucleotidyltransferase